MCNTCHNFDECETCEIHFKVQLLSIFSFNLLAILSLSLSFSSSVEASSLSFLSKALSWWWNFSFHGLFSSGWRLLSPFLFYLSMQLNDWKSPLKGLIEAQRSSLHGSFSSKLLSPIIKISYIRRQEWQKVWEEWRWHSILWKEQMIVWCIWYTLLKRIFW